MFYSPLCELSENSVLSSPLELSTVLLSLSSNKLEKSPAEFEHDEILTVSEISEPTILKKG